MTDIFEKEKKSWRNEFLANLQSILSNDTFMLHAIKSRETLSPELNSTLNNMKDFKALTINQIINDSNYQHNEERVFGYLNNNVKFDHEAIQNMGHHDQIMYEAAVFTAMSDIQRGRPDDPSEILDKTIELVYRKLTFNNEKLEEAERYQEDKNHFINSLAALAKPYIELHQACEQLEQANLSNDLAKIKETQETIQKIITEAKKTHQIAITIPPSTTVTIKLLELENLCEKHQDYLLSKLNFGKSSQQAITANINTLIDRNNNATAAQRDIAQRYQAVSELISTIQEHKKLPHSAEKIKVISDKAKSLTALKQTKDPEGILFFKKMWSIIKAVATVGIYNYVTSQSALWQSPTEKFNKAIEAATHEPPKKTR